MASVDDLGTALEHIMGARQALKRVIEDDVDDLLSNAVLAVDSTLREQHSKLVRLSNWRREVER